CRLVFCPQATCRSPLEKPDASDPDYPKAQCPACMKTMCAECKVVWHSGTTCEQYQKLPTHLKAPEDVELLGLAGREGWRQCPRCQILISRNPDGCTFMKCRCGAPFCYTCGEVNPPPPLSATRAERVTPPPIQLG
ncbi:hypothetical protein T484DRAFT_1620802, partial [Baffinella frigidus]